MSCVKVQMLTHPCVTFHSSGIWIYTAAPRAALLHASCMCVHNPWPRCMWAHSVTILFPTTCTLHCTMLLPCVSACFTGAEECWVDNTSGTSIYHWRCWDQAGFRHSSILALLHGQFTLLSQCIYSLIAKCTLYPLFLILPYCTVSHVLHGITDWRTVVNLTNMSAWVLLWTSKEHASLPLHGQVIKHREWAVQKMTFSLLWGDVSEAVNLQRAVFKCISHCAVIWICCIVLAVFCKPVRLLLSIWVVIRSGSLDTLTTLVSCTFLPANVSTAMS